jgi:hypothetical protein
MTIREFNDLLERHPGMRMHWMLPDRSFVQKDFIDCGGTIRSTSSCLLQVWVANDVEHRLETTKLAAIMRVAGPLLQTDDLPVEVEYEEGVISQYPIGGVELTPAGLLFHLGTKHTACLAPEKCGVDGTGCC